MSQHVPASGYRDSNSIGTQRQPFFSKLAADDVSLAAELPLCQQPKEHIIILIIINIIIIMYFPICLFPIYTALLMIGIKTFTDFSFRNSRGCTMKLNRMFSICLEVV